ALAANPRLLLLDEPSRGLDTPLRAELYDIVRQLRADYRMPVLLVTHDLTECFELAQTIIVLRDGRIVQQGTPDAVVSKPASLDLARLLGIFNIVPVEIRALDPSRNTSVLRLGDFDIQAEYYPGRLKGDRVHLLVTPRQLRAMPRSGRPALNQVPVQLRRYVETADSVRLEFTEGLEAEIPRTAIDRNNGEWLVEFPQRGLRIL
ncbi:MAG TPA: hypothetical protein VES20_07855, partial [Bryobacteraceae bacterium]|nr:hypothetical protein [Bryobacteraceae bacterium]